MRGVCSSVTVDLLDLSVLSKPYFDRHGLILAFDQNDPSQALGFVHASFGPCQRLSDLDQQQGIICQLRVLPIERDREVAQGLLQAGVDYLKQSGATAAHVGSIFPHAPFYLGLYGGSRVPGVLAEDQLFRDALLSFGFQVDDEVYLLERKLAGFRAIGGRNQTDIRRKFQLKAIPDPIETSWWECCLFSLTERDRFTIYDPAKKQIVSSVSFWDMGPIAMEYGVSCRGLYDLSVEPNYRRGGIATYLIGESLKALMQRGIGQVEVQVRKSDSASLALFQKLGFQQFASAFQMSRPL
jgi:ribosomal protein S18 acetylase RimI-like enzyme